MEILSNFISIHCLISFVIGAVIMLVALAIAAMGKDYEPRNKVRFFVTRDAYFHSKPVLWLERPERKVFTWGTTKISVPLAIDEEGFKYYGLNINNYEHLGWKDRPFEVFINLED